MMETLLAIIGTLATLGIGSVAWYLRRLTARVDELTTAFYTFQLTYEHRLTTTEAKLATLEKSAA